MTLKKTTYSPFIDKNNWIYKVKPFGEVLPKFRNQYKVPYQNSIKRYYPSKYAPQYIIDISL